MIYDYEAAKEKREDALSGGDDEILCLFLTARRELLSKTKQYGLCYSLLLYQAFDSKRLGILEKLCKSEGIELDYYSPDHNNNYVLGFSIEPQDTIIRKLR